MSVGSMEVGAFGSEACGLARTREDGLFLAINHTFCRWMGREPEALVGRIKLQELFTMGGRIFHQTHWVPLMRMQGSVSEIKLELLHSDGTKLPIVLNAVRRHDGGAPIHDIAAFVARDRDTYERELLQSRKHLTHAVAEAKRLEAIASDRAQLAEEMIGIVSHDLRNPLSTIALSAVLLARAQLPDKHQRTLDRITRATERANRLIADLLDFTQARIGKSLSVALEVTDLHEVIAQAVEELAHLYQGRDLRHARHGIGTCSADGNRLAQLVGNLVSNAMVYGNPEAPITVTSTLGSAEVAIAVHNEGTPIPDETAATIFRPMTRGVGASTANRSIGLGLFIVREIAKSHGGTATVRSTAETGTTFTVSFPRV